MSTYRYIHIVGCRNISSFSALQRIAVSVARCVTHGGIAHSENCFWSASVRLHRVCSVAHHRLAEPRIHKHPPSLPYLMVSFPTTILTTAENVNKLLCCVVIVVRIKYVITTPLCLFVSATQDSTIQQSKGQPASLERLILDRVILSPVSNAICTYVCSVLLLAE